MIRRVQKYFGWEKVSLMGHSMGGFISFVYATTFPKSVDLLICFDFLKPLIYDDLSNTRGLRIDKFLEYDRHLEEGKEPPSYTMDELRQRYYEGVMGSVDLEHVDYILKRNVKPSKYDPNKVYLSRDSRLKVEALLNYPRHELKEAAEKLTIPVFLSKGKESGDYEKREYFDEVVEVVQRVSPDFRFYMVPGTHHHHLNTPQSVSELLSDFLNKYYKIESFNFANKL